MADSYVCSGAIMRCTKGSKEARLTVLPSRTVFLCGKPMANVSDHKPGENLAPFGLCSSLTYPKTAAATSANHGVLTPMPCAHNTPSPWAPGKSDYIIKGNPALLKSSKCRCEWGGIISIVDDGQKVEDVKLSKHNEQTYINEKIILEDKAIVVGAYWSYNSGGINHNIDFIPFQKAERLTIVFYYKEDNNIFSKDNVKIIIRNPAGKGAVEREIKINNPQPTGEYIEIAEYEHSGANMGQKKRRQLYKVFINVFTSDLRYL